MATSGKVPTLGFLARIRNLVWLGFGSGVVAPPVRIQHVVTYSTPDVVTSYRNPGLIASFAGWPEPFVSSRDPAAVRSCGRVDTFVTWDEED